MDLLKKCASLIVVILFSCSACKDGDTVTVRPVPSVSDVSFVAASGALFFSWTNPVMEDMAYVEISYTDRSGERRRILVKDGLTQQWIEGIADRDYYDFRFLVYDIYGNVSEPVDIMAAALEPKVNLFQGRVGVIVVAKGIELSWDNDFDETFYIRVSYTDLNGGEFRHEYPAPSRSAGKVTVPVGANVSGTQTLVLEIQVVDGNDNVSAAQTVIYHKLNAGKLKRDKWRVIPSSEETEAEDGKAANLLDGDVETIWHSRYSRNKAGYPHWLILDLGQVCRLEKIGLQHRQNVAMAAGIRVYGSNRLAGADERDAWVIFGAVEMQLKDDRDKVVKGEQVFDFPAPVGFRYVKVEFLTPGDGDRQCAALSELNLYGSEMQ